MKKIYLFWLMLLLACAGTVTAQNTLTGTVTDESGAPLIGATVLVKGTSTGGITDINGRYSIKAPAGAATLLVSYTGYKTQEIAIGNRQSIDVALVESADVLNEIVVTGYSEVEAKKLISSVAVVGSKQLENIPMTDVNQLLQGRATGLYTTANSGQPGAQQAVRIRGTGSINAGRGPLYVIDGIIVDQGHYAVLDATTNAVDVLSQINPNDIENISVLKDASATALYGSRGSNGVVVITTKRGKAGKTDVTVKLQSGVTQPNFGNFKLMNAQEVWDYEREVLANSGRTQEQIDQIRPASMLDNTTDWLDEAFNNGKTQNMELQARGGNEKTRFFTSVGYFNQDGTLIESNFNRYSLRSNIDHFASDRLSFSVNLNGSYSQQNNAVDGNRFQSPIASAFTTTPLQGKTDPATGQLYTGLESDYIGLTGDNFLYSQPLNPVDVNTLRILSKVSASYKILNNLTFTQNGNIDFIDIEELDFDDPTTNDGVNDRGDLINAFSQNQALTSQSMLKYYTHFGQNHSLEALGVFEYQKTNFKTFNAGGKGFASGKLKTLDSSAEPNFVGGSKTAYSFLSYLGTLNYGFKDRYLLSASLRRDGSSRFGANNRWANFWSVGASWRISDEAFLSSLGFLNNLRLRASYGTSGNAAIDNFKSQELYGFGASYFNEPGSSPTQIGNPNLTWELSKNLNVGLDIAVLDNRVGVTVEYYNRRSEDLLLDVPVSSTSGFQTATQNLGKVRNTGVEATLHLVPFKATRPDGFDWNLDFNISFNNNEVVELPDGEDIINGVQIYREGSPIRTFYMRKWAGVNPADGSPLWAMEGGGVTGVYNQAARFAIGNAEPDFIAGLTNTFSFKGFSLSAFFYTAQGQELYNQSKSFMDSDGLRFGWVHLKDAADHWKQAGDISPRPKPLSGGNKSAASISTRYLEDGSYIRLRNVVLAYSLPTAWMRSIKMQNTTLYVQGQNLWTQTKYSGLDPEADEDGNEFFRYPVGKSITFGVDVTF